jgi:hypothetical protein
MKEVSATLEHADAEGDGQRARCGPISRGWDGQLVQPDRGTRTRPRVGGVLSSVPTAAEPAYQPQVQVSRQPQDLPPKALRRGTPMTVGVSQEDGDFTWLL